MLIEAIATTPTRAWRSYAGVRRICGVASRSDAMILLAWRGRACADVKPDLAAKWIAVATGVAPCVHGVMPIVAAMFKRR